MLILNLKFLSKASEVQVQTLLTNAGGYLVLPEIEKDSLRGGEPSSAAMLISMAACSRESLFPTAGKKIVLRANLEKTPSNISRIKAISPFVCLADQATQSTGAKLPWLMDRQLSLVSERIWRSAWLQEGRTGGTSHAE